MIRDYFRKAYEFFRGLLRPGKDSPASSGYQQVETLDSSQIVEVREPLSLDRDSSTIKISEKALENRLKNQGRNAFPRQPTHQKPFTYPIRR